MYYRPTRIKSLLRFAQILDANFPSGSFAYSFGLEPHILADKIVDITSLERFLKNIILYQYANIEFPTVLNLYKHLKNNRLNLILKLDLQLSSMLSYEYAKASKHIGENCLLQIKRLKLSSEICKHYFTMALQHKTPCNEIVLMGVFAYDVGMGYRDFLALWSKKNLINIAASSIKISKIKPSEVQYALFSLDKTLQKKINEVQGKISNFNPSFDETIYKHKFLEPKLFIT